MKAWVLHDVNDIQYEEVEMPQIRENEVLVSVKAAGICGSDIPRIYRDGAHKMPLIPGHEFSGQVVEVGDPVNKAWLQKRVGVFPLIPCNSCIACKKGQYEMCLQYSYLGSRRDGGFAEYVMVPASNLIELPESVTYEQAAMLEPVAVAVHAMRRVTLAPTDTIAVCGLGTIGQFLVMLLLERGMENIFVIGNKEYQREKIIAQGLSEKRFYDSRWGDVKGWIDSHTNGTGVDVLFECVGKNETVSQAIDLMAPGGQICLVGNPYTDMTLDKRVYWKILRSQLRVTGTWNSSFFHNAGEERYKGTDWEYVLRLLKLNRIAIDRVSSHRFPLPHLDKGFHIMRDKSENYLKIMGIVHSPAE